MPLNKFYSYLDKVVPQGGGGRAAITLAGGTAVGQAIVILSAPILSRLYTPSNFGNFAVYLSIFNILLICTSLRYDFAILLPDNHDSAAALAVLALVLTVGTSLLFWLGLEGFTRWTHIGRGLVGILPYLWLFPVVLMVAGAYEVFSYWALRRENFRIIARTKLTQSVGIILSQLGFGAIQFGFLGLVLGDVIGRCGGVTSLLRVFWRQDKKHFKVVRSKEIISVATRYVRFPLLGLGAAMVSTVAGQMPPLILALYFTPQVTGHFFMAWKVVALPVTLLGSSVAQVYTSRGARLAVTDPQELRRQFLATLRKLVFISAIPTLGLLFFGPFVFSLILGTEWRSSGVYAQLLSGAFLALMISGPFMHTLNMLECQSLQLGWDLCRVAVMVGLMVGAASLTNDVRWVIVAYVVSILLSGTAHLILSYITILKRCDVWKAEFATLNDKKVCP